MNLNGGYAMIKHDATQKDLEVAYKTKRPVLLYDADHRAHWAQINEKEVETVDEETQETIITHEYSYQLLNAIEALVDDSGNPRFIEGEGTPLTMEGFTSTYCKWSLSGTHLMVVLAGTFANTTAVVDGTVLATFKIPNFILNKIYPVWASQNIEMKQVSMYASNWSTQPLMTTFLKYNGLQIVKSGGSTLTLTADRSFRIQFDLLIDNE